MGFKVICCTVNDDACECWIDRMKATKKETYSMFSYVFKK